jgi:hypothetical protein
MATAGAYRIGEGLGETSSGSRAGIPLAGEGATAQPQPPEPMDSPPQVSRSDEVDSLQQHGFAAGKQSAIAPA